MNILFIGDVVGRAGRQMVRDHVGRLREERDVSLVIANIENAAAGNGITPAIADEFFSWGVDVMTSGNHIYDKKEILEYMEDETRLLRPANYPPQAPGRGLFVGQLPGGVRYAVLNLQGRVFMPDTDCPFRTADRLLSELDDEIKVRIVDMHGEATSEKQAMGWYLDGRVSAVLGTHTHVPTADESILPNGTAFVCDVGMTGPYDSIIGVEKALVLEKFLTQMPKKFESAGGDPRLSSVLVNVDETTGRACDIERLVVRATQEIPAAAPS